MRIPARWVCSLCRRPGHPESEEKVVGLEKSGAFEES